MAFNYDFPASPEEILEALQDFLENTPGLPNLPEIPGLPDLIEIIGGNIGVSEGTVENGALTTTNGPSSPDVLFVEVPGEPGQQQSIVVPNDIQSNTRVYTFSSDADLSMGFNTIDRAVILGNGNDFVTVAGDHDTILSGGNGNDTLITSGGDDWVSGDRGNDSISTGAGNDTIVTGLGRDTIDAGEGFDVVQFNGDIGNFRLFDVGDGDLLVHNKQSPANSAVISDAELLQFNDNESIVLVDNETEA
ncbi:Hemolysin-type calcium-binding repeat-containing protein, partial [Azotobacter beijerinckii]